MRQISLNFGRPSPNEDWAQGPPPQQALPPRVSTKTSTGPGTSSGWILILLAPVAAKVPLTIPIMTWFGQGTTSRQMPLSPSRQALQPKQFLSATLALWRHSAVQPPSVGETTKINNRFEQIS